MVEITTTTGLMIGIVAGITTGIGQTINELWIRPWIVKMKENHNKMMKLNSKTLKVAVEKIQNNVFKK